MKRKIAIVLMAVTALPLLAEEAAKPATKQPAATKSETVQDSPLVAAAKRSKRLGKTSSIVITDETVRQSSSKGHITTAAEEKPLYMPDPPRLNAEDAARDEQRRKAAEAAKTSSETDSAARKQAAERERRLAAAAAAAEAGHLDEDPAQSEGTADQASGEAKPQDRKPPQD